MAQDTLLGFPAHTLPYRCGEFTTLSTVLGSHPYGWEPFSSAAKCGHFHVLWLESRLGIFPYTLWQAEKKSRHPAKPRRSANSAQRTSLSLTVISSPVGK